ncbi:MAG: TRAP transporter fused permease subunit [Chloroflexi bacterium]|nr:TRAP transporter fused permease subunit [Chloroflexota bacterium]
MAFVRAGEKSNKALDVAIAVFGVAMVLYHLVSTRVIIQTDYGQQNTQLFFALVMMFLSSIRGLLAKKGRLWLPRVIFSALLLLLGVAATVYITVNYERLERSVGFPEPFDMVVGLVLMAIVLEATRRAWGPILSIVGIVFISYFYLGQYLPRPLFHPPYAFSFITSYLSVGFSGIYGLFLSSSVNYIFLFVVFGSLLGALNATGFFIDVGRLLGRVLAGGPAQTAVLSSALVGTCTGSAVANVAITGAFTIPAMKRIGYKPEIAGAVEATASTGGQIMPPIMGAGAFLMAAILGISYGEVMMAALLPAFFYFLGVGLTVQIIATKYNLRPPKEAINWRELLLGAPVFIVPVGGMFILLLMRYSAMLSALYAIIVLLLLCVLRSKTRPTPGRLVKGFTEGAQIGAGIGLACATLGMVAQSITTTGLGGRFALIVDAISGGNLIIALMLTMLICLILGTGVPTTAAYALTAITLVPGLVNLGAPVLPTHLFVFYFAIVSAITPPVAVASLTASSMAGATYMKTAFHAIRLGAASLIVPYIIVFNPAITLRGGTPLEITTIMVGLPLVLLGLAAMFYRFWLTGLNSAATVLLAAGLVAIISSMLAPNVLTFGGGLVILLLIDFMQRRKVHSRRREIQAV